MKLFEEEKLEIIPKRKKFTKKTFFVSSGKIIAGIITFKIVFDLLLPTPALPVRTIANNTAEMIAEYTRTYYTENHTEQFVNTTYIYGGNVEYDNNHSIELPDDYKCSILDSIVIVEHKNGIKADIKWR